ADTVVKAVNHSYVKRDTSDNVWKAPSDSGTIVLSSENAPRKYHEVGRCRNMVDAKKYNFECFQGEFVSTPETRSMYRCEFGAEKGRLFIYVADESWEPVLRDFTAHPVTGTVDFSLMGLELYTVGNEYGSPFSVGGDGRIHLGSNTDPRGREDGFL
ncbi:hypothetical protein PFISCL1PPCAC_23091, partial [Pristionchus fissidentatus]